MERWKLPRITSPQFAYNSKKIKQKEAQMFVCLIWGSYFLFAFLHDACWHQEEPSEFSFGEHWKLQ